MIIVKTRFKKMSSYKPTESGFYVEGTFYPPNNNGDDIPHEHRHLTFTRNGLDRIVQKMVGKPITIGHQTNVNNELLITGEGHKSNIVGRIVHASVLDDGSGFFVAKMGNDKKIKRKLFNDNIRNGTICETSLTSQYFRTPNHDGELVDEYIIDGLAFLKKDEAARPNCKITKNYMYENITHNNHINNVLNSDLKQKTSNFSEKMSSSDSTASDNQNTQDGSSTSSSSSSSSQQRNNNFDGLTEAEKIRYKESLDYVEKTLKSKDVNPQQELTDVIYVLRKKNEDLEAEATQIRKEKEQELKRLIDEEFAKHEKMQLALAEIPPNDEVEMTEEERNKAVQDAKERLEAYKKNLECTPKELKNLQYLNNQPGLIAACGDKGVARFTTRKSNSDNYRPPSGLSLNQRFAIESSSSSSSSSSGPEKRYASAEERRRDTELIARRFGNVDPVRVLPSSNASQKREAPSNLSNTQSFLQERFGSVRQRFN